MGIIKRRVEGAIKSLLDDEDLKDELDDYIKERITIVLEGILKGLKSDKED